MTTLNNNNQLIWWSFIIRGYDKKSWWGESFLPSLQEKLQTSENISKYGFSQEKSDTDNDHIQGFIKLKRRKRKNTVLNSLLEFIPTEHVTRLQVEAAKSSYIEGYISKEGNKVYSNQNYVNPYLKKVRESSLNYHQQQFDLIIHGSDERAVNIWCDPAGGKGKTYYLSTLICRKPSFLLPDSGSYSSVLHSCISYINSWFKSAKTSDVLYVLADLSRADFRLNNGTEIWSILEKLTSGQCSSSFSGRYMLLCQDPARIKVVVVTNLSRCAIKQMQILSQDRLVTYETY